MNLSQEHLKPGAYLKSCRLSQSLSIDDVSQKTLISLGRLKYLEADNYENVGLDIFTTGYIKKYASILGIDPEPLVSAFRENRPSDTHGEAQVNEGNFHAHGHNTHNEILSSTSHLHVASYPDNSGAGLSRLKNMPFWALAILVIVAWAVVSYFLNGKNDSTTLVASQDAIVTTNDGLDSQGVDLKPQGLGFNDESEGSSESIEGAVNQAAEVSSSSEKPTITHNMDEMATQGAHSQSAITSAEAAGESPVKMKDNIDSAINTQVDSSVSTDLITDETTVLSSMAGDQSVDQQRVVEGISRELVFTFSDDCWVSIKDATGKVVVAQIKHSGERLQLSGVGQFDVQLGNARAAALSVDGDPFLITPSAGRKTLRFKVPN